MFFDIPCLQAEVVAIEGALKLLIQQGGWIAKFVDKGKK